MGVRPCPRRSGAWIPSIKLILIALLHAELEMNVQRKQRRESEFNAYTYTHVRIRSSELAELGEGESIEVNMYVSLGAEKGRPVPARGDGELPVTRPRQNGGYGRNRSRRERGARLYLNGWSEFQFDRGRAWR